MRLNPFAALGAAVLCAGILAGPVVAQGAMAPAPNAMAGP